MAAADYPDWLRWRFELTLCYDHAVEAKNRALATWTDQLAAWLLHAGTVEMHHAGGRITARAGQWVLFPPGLPRRHRFSADAVIRSIRCSVLDPSGQPPGLGQPPILIDASDAPDLHAASDALISHLPADPWRDTQMQPRVWVRPPPSSRAWWRRSASCSAGAALPHCHGVICRPRPAYRDRSSTACSACTAAAACARGLKAGCSPMPAGHWRTSARR
jgi:hypothetical protein